MAEHFIASDNETHHEQAQIRFRTRAEDGRMRHTYTGIDGAVRNRTSIFAIMELLNPFRVQFAMRPEFIKNTDWSEALVTWCHEFVDMTGEFIKNRTNMDSMDTLAPLADRVDKRLAFVAKAVESTPEELATDITSSHGDELVEAVLPNSINLGFDWTGTKDPNFPQPTPEFMVDGHARAFVTRMDHLAVFLTVCPSASQASLFNQEDAARMKAVYLAELHAIASAAHHKNRPWHPSGLAPAEFASSWNANGSYDPKLDDGSHRWTARRSELHGVSGAVMPTPPAVEGRPETAEAASRGR